MKWTCIEGAKNRNWLFTNCVSELTYPQNALPLHGKCYFWEQAVNCRRTSELRSCGPHENAELRTSVFCGPADLRSCGPPNLRTCGPADLRTCGAADLRSCGPADLSGQKKLKIFKVPKSKFWHLGFVRGHSKAIFGHLPLNFSIISVIFVAFGKLNA